MRDGDREVVERIQRHHAINRRAERIELLLSVLLGTGLVMLAGAVALIAQWLLS